jgi:uncharacterized protein YwgA
MLPTNALYRLTKEFIPDVYLSYKSSFQTRLKVQKLVYLFEQFFGNNSYGFSWYQAGPYSSTLTKQIYGSLLVESPDTISKWDDLKFSESAQEIINKISSLISDAKRINNETLNETQLFELLASIRYIFITNKFSNSQNRVTQIRDVLLLNKPYFNGTQGLNEIIQLVIEK